MMMDAYDGQMIFGELVGLKLPDIRLTGEEKHRKNLTQETCPDRGSNPGPLRDKRACYHLFHSGGLHFVISILIVTNFMIFLLCLLHHKIEVLLNSIDLFVYETF